MPSIDYLQPATLPLLLTKFVPTLYYKKGILLNELDASD